MGIITKFKSFFKDKNNNQYYWFDEEIDYLTNNGFNFQGSGKSGIFIKGDTKIEKKAYFQYGEQYYYLLTNGDIEKRFENFSELKKNVVSCSYIDLIGDVALIKREKDRKWAERNELE